MIHSRPTSASAAAGARRQGRPPATSHAQLESIAVEMFMTKGYDATSIDEIAAAAGIGRRTFFCYFRSKSDLVFGDFSAACEGLRQTLAEMPADVPLMDALRRGVLQFNTFAPDELVHHRQRMQLLVTEPTLVAKSMVRYAEWREVVEEFVAKRLGTPQNSLVPRTLAFSALGCALAAYEQWLEQDDADLLVLLDGAFRAVATQFVFISDTVVPSEG